MFVGCLGSHHDSITPFETDSADYDEDPTLLFRTQRCEIDSWDGVLSNGESASSERRLSGAAFTPFLTADAKTVDADNYVELLRVSCDSRARVLGGLSTSIDAYLPRVHRLLHHVVENIFRPLLNCRADQTEKEEAIALHWAVLHPAMWLRLLTHHKFDTNLPEDTLGNFEKTFMTSIQEHFLNDTHKYLVVPESCSILGWLTNGECSLKYTGFQHFLDLDVNIVINLRRCDHNMWAIPDVTIACEGTGCRSVFEVYKTNVCTQDSDCGPDHECVLDLEGPSFFKELWSGDSDDTCDNKAISGGDVLHFIKALSGESYDQDASPEELEGLGFCTFPIWKGVEYNRDEFFKKENRYDDSSNAIHLFNLTSTESSSDIQCNGGFWDGTTCHCFEAFTGTVCDTCSPAFTGDKCDVCADGHGGEVCKPCPVVNDLVCSGQGSCSSGREGTGNCVCNDGFYGAACEKAKGSSNENRNRPFSELATLDCKGSLHLLSSNTLLRTGIGSAFLKDFLKEMKSLTLDTTKCHYTEETDFGTEDEVNDEYDFDFGVFLQRMEQFSNLSNAKGDLYTDPITINLNEQVLVDTTSLRGERYEDEVEDSKYKSYYFDTRGGVDFFLNFTFPTNETYNIVFILPREDEEITLHTADEIPGKDFERTVDSSKDRRECERMSISMFEMRSQPAGTTRNFRASLQFSRTNPSDFFTRNNFLIATVMTNDVYNAHNSNDFVNFTSIMPLFRNGLGDLLNSYAITLPSTCSSALWAEGEPCLFSLPLPAFHSTIRVAVDHCSESEDALPYVSIGCEGDICESFMRPCSTNSDCPNSLKCRPLVDNLATAKGDTHRIACAKVQLCGNNQQICPVASTEILWGEECPKLHIQNGYVNIKARTSDRFLRPRMNTFHQNIETFFTDVGLGVDENKCPDFEFSFDDRTNVGTEVIKTIQNLILKPSLGGNVEEFSAGQLQFCGIDNLLDGFNYMHSSYADNHKYSYDDGAQRRSSLGEIGEMVRKMVTAQCNEGGTMFRECRDMLQPWSDSVLPGGIDVLSEERKSGEAFTPFLNNIQKQPDTDSTISTLLRVSCDSRVSFMPHTGLQMEAYLPRIHFILHNLVEGLIKKITDCTFTGEDILSALDWASNYNVMDPVFWFRQLTTWLNDDTAEVVTDSIFHKLFKDFDLKTFNLLLLPSSCSWERWTTEGVCELEYDNLETFFSVSDMSLVLRITRCSPDSNLYAPPDVHLMCVGEGCRQVIEFYKTDLCDKDADCGPKGVCERFMEDTIWRGHLFRSGTASGEYRHMSSCPPNKEYTQCDNAEHSSASMLHALKKAFDPDYTATSSEKWGFCHPHLWTALKENLEEWKEDLTSVNRKEQTVVKGLKAFESNCPSCSHGTCTDVFEGNCVCDGSWQGDACDQCPTDHYGDLCLPCPQFDGKVCNGHGTCTNNGGCDCESDYTGSRCEISCPSCNHGTCTTASEGKCVCDGNWIGDTCDECPIEFYGDLCLPCPTYDDKVCNGHGRCTNMGVCECEGNFSGSRCEIGVVCGDGVKSAVEQCDTLTSTPGCVNCLIQDGYVCYTVSSDVGPTSECEDVGSNNPDPITNTTSHSFDITFSGDGGDPVSIDLPSKSEEGSVIDELESFGIQFPANLLPEGQSVRVRLYSSNPAAGAEPPKQDQGTKYKFTTVFFEVSEQEGSTPDFTDPIVFRLQLKGNECDGNYTLLLLNETSNSWESAAKTCVGDQYDETLSSIIGGGCILATNVCHLTNFAVGERVSGKESESDGAEGMGEFLVPLIIGSVVLVLVLFVTFIVYHRKKQRKGNKPAPSQLHINPLHGSGEPDKLEPGEVPVEGETHTQF